MISTHSARLRLIRCDREARSCALHDHEELEVRLQGMMPSLHTNCWYIDLLERSWPPSASGSPPLRAVWPPPCCTDRFSLSLSLSLSLCLPLPLSDLVDATSPKASHHLAARSPLSPSPSPPLPLSLRHLAGLLGLVSRASREGCTRCLTWTRGTLPGRTPPHRWPIAPTSTRRRRWC